MFQDRMPYKRGFRPEKVFFFIVAGIGFLLLVGYIVMWLWNAILPKAVGANPLSLWEAIGLLILSRILFGSFRFGPKGGKFGARRRAWREKWMNMSEEEKAEFKAKWKERCGKHKDKE